MHFSPILEKEQNLTNQLISPQTSKTFFPNIKSPVKMKPQRKVMNKENKANMRVTPTAKEHIAKFLQQTTVLQGFDLRRN